MYFDKFKTLRVCGEYVVVYIPPPSPLHMQIKGIDRIFIRGYKYFHVFKLEGYSVHQREYKYHGIFILYPLSSKKRGGGNFSLFIFILAILFLIIPFGFPY